MPRPQYARHRVDKSQKGIVKALEKAGWLVYRQLQVDLMCYKNGVWRVLEAKNRISKSNASPMLDKRRKKQAKFCKATNTPYVTTAEEALIAVGEKLDGN